MSYLQSNVWCTSSRNVLFIVDHSSCGPHPLCILRYTPAVETVSRQNSWNTQDARSLCRLKMGCLKRYEYSLMSDLTLEPTKQVTRSDFKQCLNWCVACIGQVVKYCISLLQLLWYILGVYFTRLLFFALWLITDIILRTLYHRCSLNLLSFLPYFIMWYCPYSQ